MGDISCYYFYYTAVHAAPLPTILLYYVIVGCQLVIITAPWWFFCGLIAEADQVNSIIFLTMAYGLAAHVLNYLACWPIWPWHLFIISWLRLSCRSCLYLPGLLLAAAFNYYLVATAWLPLWPTGFGLLVLKVFWTGFGIGLWLAPLFSA